MTEAGGPLGLGISPAAIESGEQEEGVAQVLFYRHFIEISIKFAECQQILRENQLWEPISGSTILSIFIDIVYLEDSQRDSKHHECKQKKQQK